MKKERIVFKTKKLPLRIFFRNAHSRKWALSRRLPLGESTGRTGSQYHPGSPPAYRKIRSNPLYKCDVIAFPSSSTWVTLPSWFTSSLQKKVNSFVKCDVFFHLGVQQCCQGAEISAAKHKKGRKNFGGAGKVRGRTSARFIKKGPKRSRTFFRSGFSTNQLYFLPKTMPINWFT
jgi:hypothetical protein